jgi:hypothetical protein
VAYRVLDRVFASSQELQLKHQYCISHYSIDAESGSEPQIESHTTGQGFCKLRQAYNHDEALDRLTSDALMASPRPLTVDSRVDSAPNLRSLVRRRNFFFFLVPSSTEKKLAWF